MTPVSQSDSRPAPLRRRFARLALPVWSGDVREIGGVEYVVETVKLADDLRDAKCTLIERHDHDWTDWVDDPVGVFRRCRRCPEYDWRPEG